MKNDKGLYIILLPELSKLLPFPCGKWVKLLDFRMGYGSLVASLKKLNKRMVNKGQLLIAAVVVTNKRKEEITLFPIAICYG